LSKEKKDGKDRRERTRKKGTIIGNFLRNNVNIPDRMRSENSNVAHTTRGV